MENIEMSKMSEDKINSLNRVCVCFLLLLPLGHEQHPGHVRELLQLGWFVDEVVQSGPAGLDYGGLLQLVSGGLEEGPSQQWRPGDTQSPHLLLISSRGDTL